MQRAPIHHHPSDERRVDLVCEGGGVKGIGLVGALALLEEEGFQVQNRAGTSAGAIVATLHAAGYSSRELYELMSRQNFAAFMDPTSLDTVPLIGQPLNVLTTLGIYKGEAFLQQMRTWLEAKGVHTFADLHYPDYQASDPPIYRHQVQVIVSDVTKERLLVLPRDAALLGVEPDALEVALAVRMSMSLPIFFEPVRWSNPRTGQQHVLVDGGMLSNFPIWLFDTPGEPPWPTFGLRLVEPDPKSPFAKEFPRSVLPHGRIEGLIEYLKSLVETMMEAHDRLYLEQDTFVRTITIPTLGVRTTDFTLSPQQAQDLYEAGRQAATTFLQTWNFPGYVAAFRRQKPPSRREQVARHLREWGEPVMR